MRRRIVMGVCLFGLALPTRPATLPYPYATEFTQLYNKAQLAMQLINQAQQIKIALQMWKQAGIQGKLIGAMSFVNIGQTFAALSQNIKQGQGLAYTMSHLDQAFRMAYPGQLTAGVDFGTQYSGWTKTHMDTIAGALKQLNMHMTDMNSDQKIQSVIRNLAGSATGETQAIQVGGMIADENVSQLMKLRQLMVVQIQTELAGQGRQTNNEQINQQIQQKALGNVTFVPTN